MKPVNPIHFFNERGASVLTQDFLERRIKALEEENLELKRQKQALARRLVAMGAQSEPATSLNS